MSCTASNSNTLAQERRFPQTAGVDDSKMGPYRALAQLSYAASQKGDNALAAKLARILERNWDKARTMEAKLRFQKLTMHCSTKLTKRWIASLAP